MERRQWRRPQHILIVDDSSDARLLWREWLSFWGFSVEEAVNGAEAITKAEAHRPDVVLMDLWMPILDGISATKRLRDNPRTADVPVLALSASYAPENAVRARAAGADDLLGKPLDPDVLIERMRVIFRRLRARAAGQS